MKMIVLHLMNLRPGRLLGNWEIRRLGDEDYISTCTNFPIPNKPISKIYFGANLYRKTAIIAKIRFGIHTPITAGRFPFVAKVCEN
jgi:hypothetical protein